MACGFDTTLAASTNDAAGWVPSRRIRSTTNEPLPHANAQRCRDRRPLLWSEVSTQFHDRHQRQIVCKHQTISGRGRVVRFSMSFL